MTMLLFGPELYYLGLAFVIFLLSLRRTPKVEQDYNLTVVLAGLGFLVTLMCLGQTGRPVFQGLPGGSLQPDLQGRPGAGPVPGPDDFPATRPSRSAAGRSFTSFSPPAPWA